VTATALLAVPACCLICIGIVIQRTIAPAAHWYGGLWRKQIVWLAVGLVLAAAVAACRTAWLRRFAYAAAAASLLALVAVPLLGYRVAGCTRWLHFGPLLVQPAEFVKLGLVVGYARFVDGLAERVPRKWHDYVLPPAALALALPLLLAQPNLQGAIIVGLVGIAMLCLVRWPAWAWVTGSALALGSVLLAASRLHAYQLARLSAFLHPDSDPLGANYQLNLVKKTIAAGGLLGQGSNTWVHSSRYLLTDAPVDFPLAVLAYEHGLVAVVLVVMLQLAIVAGACVLALRRRDTFSRALAFGVAAYWTAQAGLATAVNLAWAPPSSVSMPLISYGGSNVVTSLLALGLLLHVATRSPSRA
jgi:rod shape determining protein RodA